MIKIFLRFPSWTSLVVQWLRLQAPNAGGLGSIPGQGTRFHMLQLKILNAATKLINKINMLKKKKKSSIPIALNQFSQLCLALFFCSLGGDTVLILFIQLKKNSFIPFFLL